MYMNTAVVNIKVNPETKRQAQQVVEELGLSLSSVINGFLKQLIRTRTVTFSTSEEPSEYMIQALKESAEDIKAGRVVTFKNLDEELHYLDKMIADEKKSK